MIEKCYGARKIHYLVKFKNQEHIELHIHHDNQDTRKILENVKGDPQSLIKRYDAFSHSKIRAQFWLAKAIQDYRSFFERNAVDFMFH